MQRTVVGIASLLCLVQLSCVPGHDDPDFDPPPDSTFVSATGQIRHGDEVSEVRVARVTPEFFERLGRLPLLGRTFIAQDFEEGAEPVVVLSHDLWRRELGGSPEIIGRTVALDGRDHTVLGVMPAGVVWPPGTQIWLPQTGRPQ